MVKSPSALSSASAAVQGIIDTLATELREKVEELVDFEEILEETQASIETSKRDIKRIKTALEALTGNEIPLRVDFGTPKNLELEPTEKPQETIQTTPPTQVAPKTVEAPVAAYRAPQPICSACGGEMYQGTMSLKSGRIVSMLICSDCKNEKPLGLVG